MSILVYILQVSVCLAIFYGFYHVFLRKETLFASNRTYILVTLGSSFALPLLKIYVDTAMQPSTMMTAPVYVGTYVQNITYELSAPPSSPFPWDKLLTGIYGLGVALLSIRFLRAVHEINEIRRSGQRINILGYPCIMSDKVKTPFSFFKSIYLPSDHRLNEEELREVVSHELAHVQGKHTLDVLLIEIACVFLWPSPLIYLYRKALKDIHEYVADAAVVKDTPWEHYADLLLHQQQGRLQNVLSNQLIYSQLKKRILMMHKERSGRLARFKYLGVVPVLLLALMLFSFRERMIPAQDRSFPALTNGISDSVIHFKVGLDHKIYFGMTSLTEGQLAQVLDSIKGTSPEKEILIQINPTMTGDDLSRITTISLKSNLSVKFHVVYPEGYSPQGSLDSVPEKTQVLMVDSAPKPYTVVDEMPRFPGCESELDKSVRGQCQTEKMFQFIGQNLQYPGEDKVKGIEGIGVVKFVVQADGQLTDIEVLRSPSPAMEKELMRLMHMMAALPEKWIPGRHEGIAVPVAMTLPVKFKLDDKAKEGSHEQESPVIFPGCGSISDKSEQSVCSQQGIYKFIADHLKYPDTDRKNNIEGTGIAKFIIDEQGRMTNIEVMRSPSESIKAEILRVMQLMASSGGVWTPARKEGKAVAAEMVLPVVFKLNDTSDKPEDKDQSDATRPVKTIQVIPNPATDEISMETPEGTTTIAIFDEGGKQVLAQNISRSNASTMKVNVSGLKPGWYVVHLQGIDLIATGKFSIAR